MRNPFFKALPWVVLASGLAGTAWLWNEERSHNERLLRLQFGRLAHQIEASIVQRIDAYTDAHHGGVGLFQASEEVTRAEWRRYVESLRVHHRHPGIAGLGYIQVVEDEDLAAFEARARRDAYPEFTVRSTGLRERYYPITFIEPVERHAAVLGFDMGSEAGPFEAMIRARDTAEPVLSQRVILTKDEDQRPGFLLYVALYEDGDAPTTVAGRREHVIGWIYAPMVAEDFVAGMFATTLAEIRSQISLAVYAGDTVGENQLLYRDPGAPSAERASELRIALGVALPGQTWTIVADPTADFAENAPDRYASRTLVGGALGSFALFGLFLSMTRTRRRALTLAHHMTEDLEARSGELVASNAELARAVEAAETAADALLEQHVTLTRSERMAAVGEMAGSLAHEIRNPIAGIQMSLENLRKESADPEVRERIGFSIDELGRLSRLLSRYLSPLRHVPETLAEVDVRDLVENLCALLRYRLPENVTLTSAIDGDIRWLLPKDRIRQSLLNLVLNAIAAFGGNGGTIEVSARAGADGLGITVEDDGPGFPEALLAGPHQRFASHTGDGTGLGLAVVQRVAGDLGGELVLENREPRGARVRLVVPAGPS